MNAVMINAAMTANRIATQNALNTAMMAAQHGSHDSDAEYDSHYVFQVLVGTFLAILLAVSFFSLLCVIF